MSYAFPALVPTSSGQQVSESHVLGAKASASYDVQLRCPLCWSSMFPLQVQGTRASMSYADPALARTGLEMQVSESQELGTKVSTSYADPTLVPTGLEQYVSPASARD